MTNKKIFFLTFLCTVAVFLPIYLLIYAFQSAQINLNAQNPVTQPQSGVLVTNPTPDDTKTLLLMCGQGGAAEAESYAIIQFDAVNNIISVTSMPPQTILLMGGNPISLQDAVATAGPSQGAAALSETLGVEIKDYIFASPEIMWQSAQVLGNITLLLENHVSDDIISALGLINSGTQRYTLTPLIFSQLLERLIATEARQDGEHEVRSLGYSAFLAAGHGRLSELLPSAIKQNSNKIATNITATKLFEYERTLEFLDRQQPTYIAGALPGTWNSSQLRFELSEETLEFMRNSFGAKAPAYEHNEEDEEPATNPQQDDEFVIESTQPSAQAAHEEQSNVPVEEGSAVQDENENEDAQPEGETVQG